MANPFKTGRSRTLTCHCDVICHDLFECYNQALLQVGFCEAGVEVKWFIDETNPSLYLRGEIDSALYTDPSGGGIGVGITFEVDIAGSTTVQTVHGGLVVPPPPPSSTSVTETYDLVATIDLTLEVEEWEYHYAIPTSDPDGFPDYGGTPMKNSVAGVGIQRFEYPISGSNAVATIDVNGTVITKTVAVSSLPISTLDYLVETDGGIHCAAHWKGQPHSSGTASYITKLANLVLVGETTDAFTDAAGTGTIDNTSGLVVTANTITVDSHSREAEAFANFDWARTPNIEYDLSARLRIFNNAYSGSLTLDWLDKLVYDPPTNTWIPRVIPITLSPTGTATVLQRRQGGVYTVQFVNKSFLTLAEWTPTRAWLDLTTSVEDSNDWRTQFRCTQWNCFNLSQTNPVVIDDGSALTNWSAGSNTTLSLVSGTVKATVSGGSGGLTLNVPSTKRVWETHRYLRLKVTGSSSFTINLAFAGQNWSVDVTGTSTDNDVDLCCAGDETAVHNSNDTRFPIKSPGGFPINTDPTVQYAMGEGVNYCDSVVITGIPNGEWLEIDYVELAKKEDARLTLLAPLVLPGRFLGWTSPTDTTYVNPYAIISGDYRISDWPDLAYVVPFTGSPNARWFALSELLQFFQYLPGITVSTFTVPTDGFHDRTQEAHLLGGGGATIKSSGSSYDWTDWIDVDISATKTIPSQDLADEIQVYPGCGRCWENEAYATPPLGTRLDITKFLRSMAKGLVFRTNDKPNIGAGVRAFKTSSGGNIGSGTTQTLGQYSTGSPYGTEAVDCTTEAQTGSTPFPTEHQVWVDRQITRSNFRKDGSSGKDLDCIHHDISKWYFASYIKDDGNVYCLSSTYSRPIVAVPTVTVESQVTTVGNCTSSSLAVRPDGILLLSYTVEDPANTFTRYYKTSSDYGLTWTDEILLFTDGKYGRSAAEQMTNWLVFSAFKYVSGTSGPGNIYVRIWGPGDTAPATEVAIKDETGSVIVVADETFDMSFSNDGKGRLLLFCKLDSTGELTHFVSFDKGETFTKVYS